jgi:LPXTG-motif cell wall-anchored protein
VLAPSVFADPGTTNDVADADGTDVESVAHSDAAGVVKYTVKTFAAVRADQISEMRWDLDLDGDRAVRGTDDGCIVMKPVRGTRKLRAGMYEGCRGNAFASADARVQGQVIKLRILESELEHAGLDDDAPGYAYRFTSVERSGVSDVVPDAAGLITHTLGDREQTTQQFAAADTPTPSPSPTATAGATASPTPRPSGSPSSAKDTTSTGTADETTVEPGDDVDIEGSGFARRKGLKIFLVGGATSTATTATPSPTPSRSPTPTPFVSPTPSASATPTPSSAPNTTRSISRTRSSGSSSGDVVVGQRVGGQQSSVAGTQSVMVAAAATREQIGIAISDEDGNFDDEAEIPDETKVGSYRIVVEGPNPRGGTNTVNIPINVAAQVDNDGSSSPAGNVSTNATGTVTQASPVASAAGGATLPQTGSQRLQKIFGLGLLALILGASLMLAKRVAEREPALATHAPLTEPKNVVRLVFEIPQELRGEMQRLLARRADRYDPDRDTDL